MNALKKAMRKIGIVTLRDHEKEMEDFRSKCEEFAKDYLDASRGVTIGSYPGFIDDGELRHGGVVIGSQVSLNRLMLDNLVVAPWANQVSMNSCVMTGDLPRKNPRAVVRVIRADDAPHSCTVGF